MTTLSITEAGVRREPLVRSSPSLPLPKQAWGKRAIDGLEVRRTPFSEV